MEDDKYKRKQSSSIYKFMLETHLFIGQIPPPETKIYEKRLTLKSSIVRFFLNWKCELILLKPTKDTQSLS